MPDDYLKSCWIWICGNVVAYNPAVRIPPENNICYFQFNCYYCVCHRNVNRTKVNKKKSELDETLTPFFPLQIWFCSLPEVDSFSTRPTATFKTKGAVAIAFILFGTSFLFVNSHLTAHQVDALPIIFHWSAVWPDGLITCSIFGHLEQWKLICQ